ncbi:HD-GYP domain-containing protein [Permianibacter aggregans]|uniref:Putative nucleotidyltransferase with HDIG domain n=1 Tax=Permianibacter aggregans TaxID=1510150 RepID=A0A4R6UGT9_9GAMM|nr:HD-GYP domain-containing protein [Permianibacter aggregans]QGX39233.1 HD-GYP domain-containing protein [Permianibacter aggregans]TDQ46041.1 putative nucleotidyltransferase with HDIG domain [Permianibacter aggregans]
MEHKTLVKVQVPVGALQLGMYVCELDRPWSESPFLFQGFPLLTEDDLSAVRLHCNYVFIDQARSVQVTPVGHQSIEPGSRARVAIRHHDLPPSPLAPDAKYRDRSQALPTNTTPVAHEVEHAGTLHGEGKLLVTRVFNELLAGRELPVKDCRQFVHEAVLSIFRNENALIWYTRLKSMDEYTALHSLSVSILAAGFARHLGHSEKEMEMIGLAGLLHDVGKMKIDSAILNKPSSLTPEEFAIIKQHAKLGYDYLISQQAPELASLAAYMHHERLDGKGYPRGLRAKDIPYEARLIAIVDCYDAVTSHRVYDGARSTNEAFKVLMDNREQHFDAELVEQFIQWIGVYPVGSLVELENGEIGVVVATNPKARLRPEVIVMRDADKKASKPRYLDLAKHDPKQPLKSVRRSHPDGSFDIDLLQFEDSRLMREIYGQGAGEKKSKGGIFGFLRDR